MSLLVENLLTDRPLTAGIVTAEGVRAGLHSDPELRSELEDLVARRAHEDFPPSVTRSAVRALLRTPAYKPSGRGKPASEYLAGAAASGTFPFIDDLVDANNLASLSTGLPCSMLDADRFEGHLRLRHGRPGESYVFNPAGQEISLEGLLVACRGRDDAPLGNPVKDSLEGKVGPDTRRIVAVVYAPTTLPEALTDALAILERCLHRQGASAIEIQRT